jgi:hypothetical protein
MVELSRLMIRFATDAPAVAAQHRSASSARPRSTFVERIAAAIGPTASPAVIAIPP